MLSIHRNSYTDDNVYSYIENLGQKGRLNMEYAAVGIRHTF